MLEKCFLLSFTLSCDVLLVNYEYKLQIKMASDYYLRSSNFKEKPVIGNGHCFFRCVADQHRKKMLIMAHRENKLENFQYTNWNKKIIPTKILDYIYTLKHELYTKNTSEYLYK